MNLSSVVTPSPDRRDHWSRLELVSRARSEFAQMPGLRLTPQQASRLWSVRLDVSCRVLAELERQGVLSHANDGTFYRRDLR